MQRFEKAFKCYNKNTQQNKSLYVEMNHEFWRKNKIAHVCLSICTLYTMQLRRWFLNIQITPNQNPK